MHTTSHPIALTRKLLWLAIAMVCGVVSPSILAADTDISNQPLATRPEIQAKPNLLFILDNSGSMNWSYMPDDLGRSYSATDEPYDTWYGYWSYQCNGVAYDPSTVYSPPMKSDGSSYANAYFSAARSDGYDSSSATTNLANTYYYRYKGTQPRMGWVYTSGGADNNTFYQECTSTVGSATSVFTKVVMTSASTDAQNYANWYSFYRKRYTMMRTNMGRAMKDLGSNYRVGFTTIGDTSAVDGTNLFRDVKDFDDTQRANFYSSLYTSLPGGSTPLRTALSKAGRYFAKKVTGQTYDPMQYACQRNYALLSTDGYWNGSKGVQLNGTTEIGQQDGTEDRPMRDETLLLSTAVTTYTAPATRNNVSNTQTRTRVWTRKSSPTLPRTYTQTQTQRSTWSQTATASYTMTTVTTDGSPAAAVRNPSGTAYTLSAWNNVPSSLVKETTGDTGDGNSTLYTAGPWSSLTPTTPTYTGTTPIIGTYTAGTPVVTPSTSGGTGNTLADVAEYYYKTDLRTSALGNCSSSSSGTAQNICQDIVSPTDVKRDPQTWQHMNTYTIGLGLSGTLPYDDDYLLQTTPGSGAYYELTQGTRKWPAPYGTESNNSSGGNATNIDDLWHAAVNGRGRYYSALSSSGLSTAIAGVVASVGETLGASSAASTSSLELVMGDDNQVYRASYTTKTWFGELEAFSIDGKTAVISPTATWSAKAKLDAAIPSARKIYVKGTNGLTPFLYDNLSTAQKAYFNNFCTQSQISDQCAGLSLEAKAIANTGANLINYLRGDRTYESGTALYRPRSHVLGDIISGSPVHVSKPPFKYADAGYADFITAQAGRKAVVYTTANDGMLHAFSAKGSDGGTELWAYIPGQIMSNLYKLADTGYSNKHLYFVDGAAVMGDIKVGDVWKTILVGGFNGGGKGYYALDITDPVNPKALWEFTDANMGLSYGNPIITKDKDGTWVVVFTSGYNNGTGDGKGHLYVLNANTGATLKDIVTTAGSKTTPSGLSKINAWVVDPTNNTSLRYYGGDLLGNVWRFDTDDLVLPHQSAMLLATLQISATAPQPITTKPVTAEISGKPVVIVATGRYLGESDITDATKQSIYAIKDPLTATGWGDLRANATDFVTQTITLDGTESAAVTSTVSDNKVDWSSKAGWRIDLPISRERVFTNMGLQLNTLAIGTAIPSGDACASKGKSWLYYLGIKTGTAISKDAPGKLWSPNSIIVGIAWIKDTDGNIHNVIQNNKGDIQITTPPIGSETGKSDAHRTSWRELTD